MDCLSNLKGESVMGKIIKSKKRYVIQRYVFSSWGDCMLLPRNKKTATSIAKDEAKRYPSRVITRHTVDEVVKTFKQRK